MNKIEGFCKKIEEFAVKHDCWTCDCLQGFITQLLIDLEQENVAELKKLLKDTQFLHSCLGCDPCPPGELYSKYLRNKK